MDRLDVFLQRAERLLDRLEPLLPPESTAPDWAAAHAFRWRRRAGGGWLEPVVRPHRIALADLRGIEPQKAALQRNTRQHLAGLPANNALLWGARGTGKSSLVKALLDSHGPEGLRVVEVEANHLMDLPDITALLAPRPERFVIFCDDLSFDADDQHYRALKAVLDGSLAASADNVVIYATSNRRHLIAEYMAENQEARMHDGEIHHGDTVEEKISLSERFGLWLSFYPFAQAGYLEVCRGWLEHYGVTQPDDETVRRSALEYALERGSRSGRVALQFARDWAGRVGLEQAGRY